MVRPSASPSRGLGFKTTCCHFEGWAISFTTLCLCLSGETVGVVGHICLISLPIIDLLTDFEIDQPVYLDAPLGLVSGESSAKELVLILSLLLSPTVNV